MCTGEPDKGLNQLSVLVNLIKIESVECTGKPDKGLNQLSVVVSLINNLIS